MASNVLTPTASEMINAIPADDLSALSAVESGEADAPVETVEETPSEGSLETPGEIGDPEPEQKQEVVEDAEVPEPVAAAPAATEDLPEGVSASKNAKGKDQYTVDPERWKNSIYPAYRTVQQFEEVIGEPVTPEALQYRQDALIAQENMYNALTSGEVNTQASVMEYMLNEMEQAHQRGEVGTNPTITMADAFYQTIRQHPDAYAALRMMAAKDFIGETYKYAAETGNKSLLLSANHVSAMLANVSGTSDLAQIREAATRAGIPFHTVEEMTTLKAGGANDELSRLKAENLRLQQVASGRTADTQKTIFQGWTQNLDTRVIPEGINETVKTSLAATEANWKAFPAEYKEQVITPLTAKVNEVVKSDANFNARIATMVGNAKRATSQQVRDSIAGQIRQAFVNRANQVIAREKPAILDKATKWLADKSNGTHARRLAAQTRTAPGNAGAVPRQTLPNNLGDMPGGVFDAKIAAKQARQIIFGA
jgi:hypothetical protein